MDSALGFKGRGPRSCGDSVEGGWERHGICRHINLALSTAGLLQFGRLRATFARTSQCGKSTCRSVQERQSQAADGPIIRTKLTVTSAAFRPVAAQAERVRVEG